MSSSELTVQPESLKEQSPNLRVAQKSLEAEEHLLTYTLVKSSTEKLDLKKNCTIKRATDFSIMPFLNECGEHQLWSVEQDHHNLLCPFTWYVQLLESEKDTTHWITSAQHKGNNAATLQCRATLNCRTIATINSPTYNSHLRWIYNSRWPI